MNQPGNMARMRAHMFAALMVEHGAELSIEQDNILARVRELFGDDIPAEAESPRPLWASVFIEGWARPQSRRERTRLVDLFTERAESPTCALSGCDGRGRE